MFMNTVNEEEDVICILFENGFEKSHTFKDVANSEVKQIFKVEGVRSKKRALNKARAQESGRLIKRALKKACAQKSGR